MPSENNERPVTLETAFVGQRVISHEGDYFGWGVGVIESIELNRWRVPGAWVKYPGQIDSMGFYLHYLECKEGERSG